MVQYKLTYFDFRGAAEPTRQIFHLADVPFDDVRLTYGGGSWEKIKETTPFGQIPVLEVDGFKIPQSAAILRYVGRKYGFGGKTPEEEAWVDAVIDQQKDFANTFKEWIYATMLGKPAKEVARIRKDVAIPARDSYFKILNGILDKSKSGYLVGDGLTFADLAIADNLVSLEAQGFFTEQEYPTLAAFRNKIHNLPKLKKYIATRPQTSF